MKTTITAASLLTPQDRIQDPLVTIEDGIITAVSSRAAEEIPQGRTLEFPGMILAPGFIDIHIHGGAGRDAMEGDESALAEISRHLVKYGVTAYLPTTVTAPEDRTLKALEVLGRWIAKGNVEKGAAAIGVHLEGPFISHEKRGVHPPENLVRPTPEALDRFWQASAGNIRMMTIAPELDGAIGTIAHGRSLGVHASLGHSNASYAEAQTGIAAGAVHATHTFNAMRALDHREPGILGAVLESGDLTADIIADGIHVHPSVLKLFVEAKGPDRSVLISDAISATGMPEGTYQLGGLSVKVKDGRCEHEGRLAGSVLTLDRAVHNMMQFCGLELSHAVQMVTWNPARLLGISQERGLIARGSRADLVVLTPDGRLAHTIVAGEVVN